MRFLDVFDVRERRMNIDFVKDLIDRLIATDLAWTHDECTVELGQETAPEDTSAVISFRIQRLPKLAENDRRPFLVKCPKEDGDRKWLNDCVCQQQMSYSACLHLVDERQQELSWVTKDDGGLKDDEMQVRGAVMVWCGVALGL